MRKASTGVVAGWPRLPLVLVPVLVTAAVVLLLGAGRGETAAFQPGRSQAADAQSLRPADSSEAAPSAAAGAEQPETPVNTLRWITASEVDSFGFDIYRGTSPDGPFERITSEPLPGAGTTDEQTSYEYIDSEIDPTQGYYYYIESLSMQGVRERFSPIQPAPPKQPPEAATGTGQAPRSDETSRGEAPAGPGAGVDPEQEGDSRHVSEPPEPSEPEGPGGSSGMLR